MSCHIKRISIDAEEMDIINAKHDKYINLAVYKLNLLDRDKQNERNCDTNV
jgi:hypothetical protein